MVRAVPRHKDQVDLWGVEAKRGPYLLVVWFLSQKKVDLFLGLF